MSGRLTNMKYIAVVAVAGLSLLLAVPLSRQPVKQHLLSSSKPVTAKVAIISVPKPTATHEVANAIVTPPTITPPPKIITASYKCEAYASDFQQYNWDANVAMAICQAESSGNPSAISPASINSDGISDYGLMQLHGIDILDPAANISYAYNHKYLTQGWGAWSTYNSGAYYKYL